MNKRKNNEVFSMSFLDIMACGFGALVLILLISEFNEVEIIENKYTAEMFLNIKNQLNQKSLIYLLLKIILIPKLMS